MNSIKKLTKIKFIYNQTYQLFLFHISYFFFSLENNLIFSSFSFSTLS